MIKSDKKTKKPTPNPLYQKGFDKICKVVLSTHNTKPTKNSKRL